MLGRRTAITAAAVGLVVGGGGAAYAATHGASGSKPARQQSSRLQDVTRVVGPHHCHMRGSTADENL